MQLPDKYLDKMKNLLQDEYEDYLSCFKKESFKGLRVNTLKTSVEDFLNIFPYKLEPIPWTSDGFYYEDEEVSKHHYYYAGLYYLQEPSAMLPAELLPIDEGDYVLDACAAPGGKSTKLGCKLGNTGILMSNDISASRAQALLKNIVRFGIKNAFVTSEDISKLESKYTNTFDKILIDAPCSGEGMFRKEPSLISSWLERDNSYFSPIQKEILESAVKMCKDGGKILYSTCTFSPDEDEEVIEYVLNKYPDLKLLPIKMHEGFTPGRNNIGVKLFPHKIKGEGHYVCLLQKGEGSPKIKSSPLVSNPNIDFFKHINSPLVSGLLCNLKDNLYITPDLDTSHIRTLRSGLHLGELKKDRFEPSQALALALKSSEFDQVLNLSASDERVIKYLKGETISCENLEGWVLVCVDNYPLGFGKASGSSLKNKIDKGWIYR